eukprot:g581.t1
MGRKKVPVKGSFELVKSRRKARKLTSTYHNLTRELKHLKTGSGSLKASGKTSFSELSGSKSQRIKEIEAELGRRKRLYQEASRLTTSSNKSTSKFVFQQCHKHGLVRKNKKLKTLEVGAINTQIVSCPWLNVRAIDLESNTPLIEECDFFTIKPKQDLDLLVLAMVINYVDEPERRGDMLKRCYSHLLPGAHFALVLPRRCIERSQYMSKVMLNDILERIGFEILEKQESPKIVFYFCRKKEELCKDSQKKLYQLYKHPPKRINTFKKNTNDFSISFKAI